MKLPGGRITPGYQKRLYKSLPLEDTQRRTLEYCWCQQWHVCVLGFACLYDDDEIMMTMMSSHLSSGCCITSSPRSACVDGVSYHICLVNLCLSVQPIIALNVETSYFTQLMLKTSLLTLIFAVLLPLFAARCYASAALAVIRCLSVCLPVCLSRSYMHCQHE